MVNWKKVFATGVGTLGLVSNLVFPARNPVNANGLVADFSDQQNTGAVFRPPPTIVAAPIITVGTRHDSAVQSYIFKSNFPWIRDTLGYSDFAVELPQIAQKTFDQFITEISSSDGKTFLESTD